MVKSIETLKELWVEVPNKVGICASLTEGLVAKKINILAVSAVTLKERAWVHLVTDNNAAALKVIQSLGWKAVERPALRVVAPNKVGVAHAISATLAKAGINIEALYASAIETQTPTIVVVPSDVAKAERVLKAVVE